MVTLRLICECFAFVARRGESHVVAQVDAEALLEQRRVLVDVQIRAYQDALLLVSSPRMTYVFQNSMS